jgi:hypothetical protein
MSVEFERGWLQHTVDHLTTETLARRLIRSASRVLAQNTSVEVLVWCNAANGGAHVLRVTKGLHQPEGPLADLMHITMRLYIPGSKQGDLVPNTNYPSKFHLYAKILNPASNKNGYRLQPTRLSYQTAGHAFNEGNDFIQTDIHNADALSSDLASKT